jgi:hypothetical protein
MVKLLNFFKNKKRARPRNSKNPGEGNEKSKRAHKHRDVPDSALRDPGHIPYFIAFLKKTQKSAVIFRNFYTRAAKN